MGDLLATCEGVDALLEIFDRQSSTQTLVSNLRINVEGSSNNHQTN